MGSEKQTAVNLTEYAQVIKDRFSAAYGLKNILSAGLVLLNRLAPRDRESLIVLVYSGTAPEIEAFLDELAARLVAEALKHKRGRKDEATG